MKKLVQFFVDRPLVVNLIVVGIVIYGMVSIVGMRKEGFPDLTFKSIYITTIYPGASARDVEMNVTVAIEQQLSGVTGIDELLSSSVDGLSFIEAKLADDVSDMEMKSIQDDIDAEISAMDNLPSEIESRPVLDTFSTEDMSIVELAFSGSKKLLREWIPRIEKKLNLISEVSIVDVVGLPDQEIQILVDPDKANRYQIGLASIAKAIQVRNSEGSGGTLESFIGEKKVVSVNKFQKPDDVLDTYLRVSDLGYQLKLRQIARVRIVDEEKNLRVFNNGERGVSILIKKKITSDIIATINKVQGVIDGMNLPKELKLVYLNDKSSMTRNRLDIVTSNGIFGFILVLGVLLFVFDKKTAFWVAFGIPFSFFGAFIVLSFTDMTLNMLSLGGFILVLGMLVDDAIVIGETIYKHREDGMPARKAAIMAVSEIWKPVLASSLTTMISFSPILALGGLPGQFIYIIPLIVVIALVVSLFEAYFLLPVHLSEVKSVQKVAKKGYIVRLESIYSKVLSFFLKHKVVTIPVFIIPLALSIFIVKNYMTKDSFPQEAADAFTLTYTSPVGYSFEKTRELVRQVEQVLDELPKDEIMGYSTRLGTQAHGTSKDRGSEHNTGVTFMYLTPFSNRSRNIYEIIEDVRAKINSKAELIKKLDVSMDVKRIGPPLGYAYEIRVSGNDDVKRNQKVQEIISYLKTVKGLKDVRDDQIPGKPELNIKLNHKTLSQSGLNANDILTNLRIAFDGIKVTQLVTLDTTYDFRLRLNEKGRANVGYLNNLPVQNALGNIVKTGSFIHIQKKPGQAEIKHVNGVRTVTVIGDLDRNVITGDEVAKLVLEQFTSTSTSTRDVEISIAGEPVESGKIFEGLGKAALIAIVGLFLILALILNSLSQPIIILLAIPFGAIGVILANFFHGLPMSMFVGIGLVGLTGVVINDSIVMADAINKKLKSTKDAMKAIHDAAITRLRPVLLTTITTVFGVLPSAYGIGGYDPFVAQLCLTLGYGLLFATTMILILVPVSVAAWYNANILISNMYNSLPWRKK